jgi:hypothetical protein
VGSTDCQSYHGVAIRKNDLLREAPAQLAYVVVYTELPAVTVAVTVDTTGAGGEGPGRTGSPTCYSCRFERVEGVALQRRAGGPGC